MSGDRVPGRHRARPQPRPMRRSILVMCAKAAGPRDGIRAPRQEDGREADTGARINSVTPKRTKPRGRPKLLGSALRFGRALAPTRNVACFPAGRQVYGHSVRANCGQNCSLMNRRLPLSAGVRARRQCWSAGSPLSSCVPRPEESSPRLPSARSFGSAASAAGSGTHSVKRR